MTAFEAQMQQCGKTETKFLDILAIALYPCDAHDASGLLHLRPRTGTPIVVAWQAMNGAVVMRSVYAPQDEEDDAWEQTAVINGIMTARKLVDMVSNDAFVDWQQWRKENTIGDIDRLRSADVSRPTEVWICPDTLSNEWGAVTLRNNEMLTVTNQPHTLSLLLCFAPDALICVEISGGAEEKRLFCPCAAVHEGRYSARLGRQRVFVGHGESAGHAGLGSLGSHIWRHGGEKFCGTTLCMMGTAATC